MIGFNKLTYWLSFQTVKIYILMKVIWTVTFHRENLYALLEDLFFSYGSVAVSESLDNGYFEGLEKMALRFGRSVDRIVRSFDKAYC